MVKKLSDIVKDNASSAVVFSSLVTLAKTGINTYENNSSYFDEFYKINTLVQFIGYTASFFLIGSAIDYFRHKPKKEQQNSQNPPKPL